MRASLYGAILFVPLSLRGVLGTAEESKKCQLTVREMINNVMTDASDISENFSSDGWEIVQSESDKWEILRSKSLNEQESVYKDFRREVLKNLEYIKKKEPKVESEERIFVYAMLLRELGMLDKFGHAVPFESECVVPEVSIGTVNAVQFRVVLCLFKMLKFDTLVLGPPARNSPINIIWDENYELLQGCGIKKIMCRGWGGWQLLSRLRLTGKNALPWDKLESLEFLEVVEDPRELLKFIEQHDKLNNLGLAVYLDRSYGEYFGFLKNERFLRITTKLVVLIRSTIRADKYRPIFSEMENLKRLELNINSLSGVTILEGDDKLVPAFSGSLEYLKLQVSGKRAISDGFLSMLSNVEKLKELHVGCLGCDDKGRNVVFASLLESPTIRESIETLRISLDLSDNFDLCVLNECPNLEKLEIEPRSWSSTMNDYAKERWNKFLKSNEKIKTLWIRPPYAGSGGIPHDMLASIAKYAQNFEHIRLMDNEKDIFKIFFSEEPGEKLKKNLKILEITDNGHRLEKGCIINLEKYSGLEHLIMLARSGRGFYIPPYSFGVQISPEAIRKMKDEDWKGEWAVMRRLKLKENTLRVTKENVDTLTQTIGESVEKVFVYFGDDIKLISGLKEFLTAISNLGTVEELHLSGKKGVQLDEEHIGILFGKGSRIWGKLKRVYVRSGIVEGDKLQNMLSPNGVKIIPVESQKHAASWDEGMSPQDIWFFYEGMPGPLHLEKPYSIGGRSLRGGWGVRSSIIQ